MGKAQINLEIEQEILANAEAYVARCGGSLDNLVSAFLSALGTDERASSTIPNPTTQVLLEVSSGRTSLVEGARMLGMQDAGYLLQRLRDVGLTLPQLPESDSRLLADKTSTAFADCLLDPVGDRDVLERNTTPEVSK